MIVSSTNVKGFLLTKSVVFVDRLNSFVDSLLCKFYVRPAKEFVLKFVVGTMINESTLAMARRFLCKARVVVSSRNSRQSRQSFEKVTHQLESRTREIRQYGSEGGGLATGSPYPSPRIIRRFGEVDLKVI